jgi:hypothetical protein
LVERPEDEALAVIQQRAKLPHWNLNHPFEESRTTLNWPLSRQVWVAAREPVQQVTLHDWQNSKVQ